jgi:hypothetical protein
MFTTRLAAEGEVLRRPSYAHGAKGFGAGRRQGFKNLASIL